MTPDFAPLQRVLDQWAAAGHLARFWLRDDDAVTPTSALDRLLEIGASHAVPLTLAVIPQPTGPALAGRLAQCERVEVAVHGWAHANHARPGRKSCELGDDRPSADVLVELAAGLHRLGDLHGSRAVPLLVPPWNRIAPDVVSGLPGIGYAGLSVYGPEPATAPLTVLNTHIDLIDWHGTRGGRPTGSMVSEITARLRQIADTGPPAGPRTLGHVGILSHHLVHDRTAWNFLAGLLAATVGHPGCRWMSAADLVLSSPPTG